MEEGGAALFKLLFHIKVTYWSVGYTETITILHNFSSCLLLRNKKYILKELVGVKARLGWEAVKK